MATTGAMGEAAFQPLNEYPPGLLHIRGSDARKFLQGQLSNDMDALSAEAVMLAGLHNPQGRVLALLRLSAPSTDHIIAVLPAGVVATAAATLRRYVLRAKVVIEERTDPGALSQLAAQLPALAPMLAPTARASDIANGMPQVYAATSGKFVSQMLNLDCVGAVSFDKGCYTGQEIIARTHYRGRMKRRMQRFLSSTAPLSLTPGQPLVLGDGRPAQLVDSITRADGSTEFLAVTPRAEDSASSGAAATGNAGAEGRADAGGAAEAGPLVECRPLPLPYSFPD